MFLRFSAFLSTLFPSQDNVQGNINQYRILRKNMAKLYEIRDPIHGFVTLNDWERDIVNHSAFQRLRRIRQLSMTDMVYPGAMHTRFEHSLGVMHVATRMFDSLNRKGRR